MTRRAGQLLGAIDGGIIRAEIGSDSTVAVVGGVGSAMGGDILGERFSRQRQEHAAIPIDQLTQSLPAR
jgi:uncharacterized protein YcfJ